MGVGPGQREWEQTEEGQTIEREHVTKSYTRFIRISVMKIIT